MRRFLFVVAAIATLGGWFVSWWRRNRRFGSETMNRIVNPWLVRRGVTGDTRGEVALVEHVGRRSGTVRISPVHPARTESGYRLFVPLGDESEWAKNILAAGHCRLQVGDTIHELDEPRLVKASEVEAVPKRLGRAMDWLGFEYLLLHQFREEPGTLRPVEGEAEAAPSPEAVAPEVAPEEVPTSPEPELAPTA